MENYFLLKQKDNLIEPFHVNLMRQKIEKETTPCILFSNMNDNTSFSDLFYETTLLQSFCFVSEALFELFQVYTDDIETVPVVFLDNITEMDKLYYKITLENLYCIKDTTVMKYSEIVILRDELKGKFLFEIECNRQRYIIASLHLVENMLRKNFYGIDYIPVSLRG